MFHVIDERFFVPLGSPNKIVYWECICKLFSVLDHQLSFGVERDKANWMIRKLEFYGWLEIETDKSYVQRVSFKEYAVKIIRTLIDIAEGKQIEY